MSKSIERQNSVVLLTLDAESAEVRGSPHLLVRLSKGRLGPRVGLGRVIGIFDRQDVKSTFFVPAWTAQGYEDSVHRIHAFGHEPTCHEYLHENLSPLSPEEEWKILEKSINVLENTVGVRPQGFRTPYRECGQHIFKYLRKLGFIYDSSLMNDDKPYLFEEDGSSTRIVELPVEWLLDEWPLFEVEKHPPKQVCEMWRSEFDASY